MMAQCYSGSFANLIYENGDPAQPVALQTRCGFFATVGIAAFGRAARQK